MTSSTLTVVIFASSTLLWAFGITSTGYLSILFTMTIQVLPRESSCTTIKFIWHQGSLHPPRKTNGARSGQAHRH
ncbi:hypothetical protein EV126DRAFT_432994 [Verticillium dahliae]|nr:hypothetical protein EV126DRAFT_435050 [Verticillium dahliae]KAH6687675.1 hypothetical protein EV126DRAFT_432994 [Verticillium dahliae]